MRLRPVVVLLTSSGVLLLLHPVLRPYSAEVGTTGAEAFASPLWVLAHVAGMFGLLALVLAVRALAVSPLAETLVIVGVALLLPYYGAEAFGLEVLGRAALEAGDPRLLELAEPIRFGTVQVAMFIVGLVLVAAAGVVLARRIGVWQAWLLGAGLVLLGPQFFGPPWVRITHGVLVLAGCLVLAKSEQTRQASLPATVGVR